jgi:hypothetical protein
MDEERFRMEEQSVRDYIKLLHSQREALFAELHNVPEERLWTCPGPKEWTVGENLDHIRVIYRSTLPWLMAAWYLLKPLSKMRRKMPYQAEIDNVYLRPGFPRNAGWMWPPHYTPTRSVSLEILYQNMKRVHEETETFYLSKDPALLGHVTLWDPAIGRLNLIQALRVGIFHDELHINQIRKTLEQLG